MALKVKEKPVKPIADLAEFEAGLSAAFAAAVADPENAPGAKSRAGNPVNLAPRIPEASTMSAKLVGNAQANAANWLANVLAPRKSPVAEMKKSSAKYKTRMQESLAAGDWDRGVANIDEGEMYATINALGSAVFTQGLAAREPKITRVFGKMRPLLLALTAQLDAMPTDTDGQREAKMIAAKRGMQALGKQLRGTR